MKVRCIYKACYMWCEIGDELEVLYTIEPDERHKEERYGLQLKNVIGFYPKKYFEVVYK